MADDDNTMTQDQFRQWGIDIIRVLQNLQVKKGRPVPAVLCIVMGAVDGTIATCVASPVQIPDEMRKMMIKAALGHEHHQCDEELFLDPSD